MSNLHVFYQLVERIDHHFVLNDTLPPEEWYTMWRSWLDELLDAPVTDESFSYSDDMLYMGSAAHAINHPNCFASFIDYTQSRIHEWSGILLSIAKKYENTIMTVEDTRVDSRGEYQTTTYQAPVYKLFFREAWRGKYLDQIEYHPEIHGAIESSMGLVPFQECAWLTHLSGKPHSAWTDIAMVMEHYSQTQFGDYPYIDRQYSKNKTQTSNNTDFYLEYMNQIRVRAEELKYISWDKLPEIFREPKMWNTIIRAAMDPYSNYVDLSLFPLLPQACQKLLTDMGAAFHVFMQTLDLEPELIFSMILNMVPKKENDAYALPSDAFRTGAFRTGAL